MRVALACNLIRPAMLAGRPLDTVAELDCEETIRALEAALRSSGHEVVRIEADAGAPAALARSGVGIVFNVAEGLLGESRESLIPAICEVLDLPYTGSGVLTTAMCLDKSVAKTLLRAHGVLTPRGQVFVDPHAPLDPSLEFPLIVKLAREGSSMGLSRRSIVDDESALRERIAALVATYGGPALAEEFVAGREFTVGVLGNDVLEVLPIVEVVFSHPRGINVFQPDEPLVRMAASMGRAPEWDADDGHDVVCPAKIDDGLARRIRETVCGAFRALGCRDWCRIDLRLGDDGRLYVLELNPIAGLDPSYLLPRAAAVAGYSYDALITRILDLALARTGARAVMPRP